MPSATMLGKVFAPIPHGAPLYQMLDLKLAMYRPLLPRLPPGVLLVCADDFLVYDLGQEAADWSIPASGFTALAHPSPMSVGRTHGVYVVEGVERLDTKEPVVVAPCLEVLQKPSDDRMRRQGALLKSETGRFEFAAGIRMEGDVVYTDSCFFFGVDVMKKLLGLKREVGVVGGEIDAYGDFLQALGPRATDDYIYNTANVSRVTSDLTRLRKQVFDAVRGCDIHLLILNASKFIHIGTTRELIYHFCQDEAFRCQMALERDVFNCWQQGGADIGNGDGAKGSGDRLRDATSGSDNSGKSRGCVMHSVLVRESTVAPSSVVEYCRFDAAVTVEGGAIVSNCQWLRSESPRLQPLVLPPETFLHTVSVLHQGTSLFVTVFFHIADNLKTSVPASDLASLPFLQTTLGSALKQWRLAPNRVSPQGQGSEAEVVSLWTLRLYLGARTMTESLEVALDMVHSAQDGCSLARALTSDDCVFFSLSDALAQKDVTTMLNFRRRLFDEIQAGREQAS